MFVIVSYDVPAKRTSIYRKLLKEFLIHEQASVFMGDLPESRVIILSARIADRIGPDDKVLKLVCKNRHNVEISRLSKEAQGGPMRKEKDKWHGEDWAII